MLNKNVDRRKYPRGKGDVEYLFPVEIDLKGKKIISEVKDISCGGLMCKVNHDFQQGKEVKVTFLIPRYTKSGMRFCKIQNKGLIVRCEHFPELRDIECRKLAIAFQGLSKKDKNSIAKYVDYVKNSEKKMQKKAQKSRLHVEHDCIITQS